MSTSLQQHNCQQYSFCQIGMRITSTQFSGTQKQFKNKKTMKTKQKGNNSWLWCLLRDTWLNGKNSGELRYNQHLERTVLIYFHPNLRTSNFEVGAPTTPSINMLIFSETLHPQSLFHSDQNFSSNSGLEGGTNTSCLSHSTLLFVSLSPLNAELVESPVSLNLHIIFPCAFR